MRVILLQDIKGLGKKFDVKEVKSGYARNFLLPKNLAKIATEKSIKEIERQKTIVRKRIENLKEAREAIAEKLKEKEFHFYVEVGEHQEVFGSITKDDVKRAIKDFITFLPPDLEKEILKKIKIDSNRTLKTLGEHLVEVNLGEGLEFQIKAILNQKALNNG
ncbi:MAG: 50S ribosomal protein L9 [Candidatus Wolfebacteria bacterium GW2011_GWA2_42_10]|uniref:Large ribosomal subunit protein bL9 n=2 Tax=Candidatus Wolfeibacteriota TaxID=1752735 RepID=A0A0G0XLC5_9BACT|nr:MAG: 50S ribosomal protein L9 [Candidatus Wolfebacteria bacterium GW2011_GWB1_41_12]KKS25674.1 MAG: 50S ribosomal protein L9 [Candidatus Wolfebacteria bacterium GW2011_GWA2_42_10]KKT56439.1 MAG: 50S ribosomal protein L9 [Candidatus Wolfebacteria bacterium GW2011_GWA1_44_24]